MSEFLTTHGTTARLEEIILKARQRIVLITPYLQFSRILYERLAEADKRGVQIVFVCREEDLRPDERDKLVRLKNISIYFCPNLHAKCYFNEEGLVISSLNLYEASEKNREMGVFFKRGDGVFNDAVREAQSIIEVSHLEKGTSIDLIEARRSSGMATVLNASCIRCADPIPFALNTPFCGKCYAVWAEFGNPFYEENYCHRCGKPFRTTRKAPECHDCAGATRSA